jgi:branched-chain amino acid transport system permease protein
MRRRWLRLAGLAAAVVAVHLAAGWAGKPFYLTQLTMAGYYTLVAVGLSLLMGFAGQISMAHAAFFAIGGYVTAVLTTLDLSAGRGRGLAGLLERAGLLVAFRDAAGAGQLALHPWPAAVVAIALAAAVAVAIGVPVLRLKGHYLAMATLGFGTIVIAALVGTERLGAADGLTGVPPFPLAGGLVIGGGRDGRVANYYVAWGLVAVAMWLLGNLVESRVGRALRAIHGAEDAAASMGVDVGRYKLATFVISAALAALGGVGLTHLTGGIGPGEASVMKSVRYVAVVAVGGMGSLWGTLATSALLTFLSLRGTFGTYDDAVFAAILLVVMLFSPDGVLRADLRGAARALWARGRPRPDAEAP